MFRSIALATFRSQRRSAFAWGAALAAFTLITMWSNWRSEYPTEEARQRLAEQVEGGLAFVQVLFGEPVRVDEFRGHLEWRGLGLHPLLLGLFMVMSATAVSRGSEERGELDLILTAPRSRSRIFIEQASGVALALLAACAFVWFAALVSGPTAGEPVPPAGLALLSIVNLGLVAALFGAIAFLVAQLVHSRRVAATTVGAILVGSYFWSNLGLIADSLEGWRWLSPFYLYSRSTPLADGQVSAWALSLLAALTLACLTGAGLLFTRRDAGAPVSVPWPAFVERASRGPGHGAGGTWLLGDSFQRGVRAALGQTVIWGMGAASFAALFTAVTPAIRRGFEDLSEASEAAERFEFDLTSDAGIISALLFLVVPLLLCLFAATVTSAMASQEQSGRLELDLVYPVRRISYFLQRATAALLAVAVATALPASAFLVTAFLMDFDLN